MKKFFLVSALLVGVAALAWLRWRGCAGVAALALFGYALLRYLVPP